MSYNNHDKDDPNGTKYQRSKTAAINLRNLSEIETDDENYELMQIYLMAKAIPYSKWKLWLKESKYYLTHNQP